MGDLLLGEERPRRIAVARDLGLERVEIGVACLVPDLREELDPEVPAVEVGGEVEEMRFERGRAALLHGWPDAEARDAGPWLVRGAMDLNGENAAQRRAVVLQLHVGRRESEGAAKPVALHHAAADAVG